MLDLSIVIICILLLFISDNDLISDYFLLLLVDFSYLLFWVYVYYLWLWVDDDDLCFLVLNPCDEDDVLLNDDFYFIDWLKCLFNNLYINILITVNNYE